MEGHTIKTFNNKRIKELLIDYSSAIVLVFIILINILVTPNFRNNFV